MQHRHLARDAADEGLQQVGGRDPTLADGGGGLTAKVKFGLLEADPAASPPARREKTSISRLESRTWGRSAADGTPVATRLTSCSVTIGLT